MEEQVSGEKECLTLMNKILSPSLGLQVIEVTDC